MDEKNSGLPPKTKKKKKVKKQAQSSMLKEESALQAQIENSEARARNESCELTDLNASHTSKPEFHFNYNSNKLVPESNFNSRANS